MALIFSLQAKAANFTETDSGSLDTIDALATDGVGGYFQSNTNYGLIGTSAYGTSLWASPQVSGNTSPTVVIESLGGSSDQLQVQDMNGNPELVIKDSGLLLLANASDSCDASTRRGARIVEGGPGVADSFQLCLKASGGSYSWVTK